MWVYFTVRGPGNVVITASYTYPDSTFYLWLVPGHCTYEMSQARQCSWTSTSFSGGNPRTLVQSVVAGEYTLVLDNRDAREERIAFQVVYTGSVAASGAATAAATRAPAIVPNPERRLRRTAP